MKFYTPAAMHPWECLKPVDGNRSIKMNSASIGFIVCFATYEACKSEFPKYDVLERDTAVEE